MSPIIVSALLFAVGLFLLIKGADWLVDGASAIAQVLKIPEIVVGLTIVAFGTSAPELIINVIASITNKPEIAVGNVLGSNMANILLILGISALFSPLVIARSTLRFELPFSILAVVFTGILAHNCFLGDTLSLSRFDGLVLLGLFGLFWIYTIHLTKSHRKAARTSGHSSTPSPDNSTGHVKNILLVIAGVACLFLGGKWVVDGATTIAKALSIPDGFIAITMVAIGTSLPELATSISAARRNKTDIVAGNAIGSNIFNLLWVLGLSSVIHPIPYQAQSDVDIWANIFTGFIMLGCVTFTKGKVLNKWSGLLFLTLYAIYIGMAAQSRLF